MWIMIESNDDRLVVYRQKTGVILYKIFLAVCCIAFGVTFSYVGRDNLFPLLLGIVFTLLGALILLGFPKSNKTMKNHGGAILISANKEGVSISPDLNMTPVKYVWADISQIVLTKKLITKEAGEDGCRWNQAIVFFQSSESNDDLNLLVRSKRQMWKSPKGHNISIIDIPEIGMDHIKEMLMQLSMNIVEIASFSNVTFDYVSKVETYQF